jgi:hypothetical protein
VKKTVSTFPYATVGDSRITSRGIGRSNGAVAAKNESNLIMMTYTHFLVALALSRWLRRHPNLEVFGTLQLPPFHTGSFLFGSVLPDLPLIVTAAVCTMIDSIQGPRANMTENVTFKLFDSWYFHNPWVKAEHNMFHSQVTLLCFLLVAFRYQHMQRLRFAFWVVLSAWLHATPDIGVHHDDGPLIFFPIDWEFRYHSPLSYYDPQYHGRIFSVCEHIVDLIIILRECYYWWCHRDRGSNSDVELETFITNKEDVTVRSVSV